MFERYQLEMCELLVVKGIYLAIIELVFIFASANYFKSLIGRRYQNLVSYYWLYFTFFTGIWEFYFLLNYDNTCNLAQNLLENKEHVWTNSYSLFNLFPNKFSQVFYSEYGAYADREYMEIDNNWSRIIEGTHCIFCGIGSLLALTYIKNKKKYLLFCGSAMASQAMNSILYIANYFHETRDPSNPNFNTTKFPTGHILNKRPFMYINILWTIMPLYVLYKLFKDEQLKNFHDY